MWKASCRGGAMLAPRKAEMQGCARSASVGAPPARARSRRARRPEQEAWRCPHRESWQRQLVRPCIPCKRTCQGGVGGGCVAAGRGCARDGGLVPGLEVPRGRVFEFAGAHHSGAPQTRAALSLSRTCCERGSCCQSWRAVCAPCFRSSCSTEAWPRAVATSSGVWGWPSTSAAACGLARRSRRAAATDSDPLMAATNSAVRGEPLLATRLTEACHLEAARLGDARPACSSAPHPLTATHYSLSPATHSPTLPPIERQSRVRGGRQGQGQRGRRAASRRHASTRALAFASSSN